MKNPEMGGMDKNAVMERHREEWAAYQKLFAEALASEDLERLKLSKLAADALKISQECERKVWGIDDANDSDDSMAIPLKVTVEYVDTQREDDD